MSAKSASSILGDLDKELGQIKWRGPPSDMSHLGDIDHIENFKKLGNYEHVISKWIVSKAMELVDSQPTSGPATAFRICSIGCEDGTLDQIILQSLGQALPTTQIHYTGIEMDDQVCELAEEKLSDLAPNIHIQIVAEDYEELKKEDQSEPYDLIFMVNCTYYASSLDPLLKGAVQLLKPSGELVIVSSSRQSFDELITRFWSHQRSHDLYTSETVVKTLSSLGIMHNIFKVPVTFDLTACFKDEFESPAFLLILDHLVFTRLRDYPPEVSKLCVMFLRSIAENSGSKMVITSVSDMIVIRNK